MTCNLAISQRYADIGLIAGGSYYMGDLTPNAISHFTQLSPAFGAIYRYSFNYHHAVKATVLYNAINSTGTPLIWDINQSGGTSTKFLDASIQYEFNFLKYRTTDNKDTFAPYLSFGAGYALGNVGLTIPFGGGIKVNINDRLSSGLEWTMRKTLTDNIDGVINRTVPGLPEPVFNNKDWYSFTGLFITYKFFKFADKCPTYFDD